MQMVACPDDPALARMYRPGTRRDDTEAFARHLKGCAGCQDRAERFFARDDLTRLLRSPRQARLVVDASALKLMNQFISRSSEVCTPVATQETWGTNLPDQSSLSDSVLDVTALFRPPQGPGEMGRVSNYRVLRKLGSGGMGVVFLAEDTTLGRLVALKIMKPGMGGRLARMRFIREAQAAAAVRHDHVVTLYQVGEDNGLSWLAMEYLEGETLETRLRREGALPLPEVLRIGRQIAEGLAAAHAKGQIHRDIKPSNIWLEAPTGRVKILDFGMALPVNADTRITVSGAIAGTPGYISYEQLIGQDVDTRTDLYSLGCVLYRMAAGRPPYPGDNAVQLMVAMVAGEPRPPREYRPELPEELNALICGLLRKDAGKRTGPAEAVAAALTPADRGAPPVAVLVEGLAEEKQARSLGWWQILMFLVAMLLLGVVIGVASQKGGWLRSSDGKSSQAPATQPAVQR